MVETRDFTRRLFEVVLDACYRVETGVGSGWDASGVEWSESPSRRARDAIVSAAGRAGFARRRFDVEQGAEALSDVVAGMERFARTYSLLADERSRRLLLDLLAFRALGPWHVRLPIRNREFHERLARLAAMAPADGESVKTQYGEDLPLQRVRGRAGEISLYTHPMVLLLFYELEQYAYRRDSVTIAAETGDVVIDGGAAWGVTALYFADAVGSAGRVLGFEIDPENLRILQRNLDANLMLRDRVEVFDRALWSATGETLRYSPSGPMSAVAERGDAAVEAVALDDVGIDRVDFVKLDVEGAELAALRGAERTLRRDRPKLAIAAYHHDRDLAEIPAWIDDLGLGYRFHLDHFSPGWSETILYGTA